jgi:hypothetical protein
VSAHLPARKDLGRHPEAEALFAPGSSFDCGPGRMVAHPSVTAICLTSGACKKLFGQDLVFEHEVPANITVGVLAFFAQDNPLRGRDAALEENSSMIWQS